MAEPGTSARPDLPLAVVVGAGGLGLAIARRLGERNRLLVADRDESQLAAAATALRAGGHDVAIAQCDVTDAEAVGQLAATAAGIGPVRVLAHVVGLSPAVGDWRAIMHVDLVGAALMESAMLPVASPATAAIFVTSLAGHRPPPDQSVTEVLDDPLAPEFFDAVAAALGEPPDPGLAYSLAKWALIRRCRQRAAAWGARSARIVSVSPGLIATPMGAVEYEKSTGKRDILAKVPLEREGTMLEIADAVDFLASDRASYISGTDLLVDGGVAAALGS